MKLRIGEIPDYINPIPDFEPTSLEEFQREQVDGVGFSGEANGNYGNPTNYSHNKERIKKISDNNSRHWKGKEVPWKGSKRPDSVKSAYNMGKNNMGKTPWNKGVTDYGVKTIKFNGNQYKGWHEATSETGMSRFKLIKRGAQCV